EVLVDLARVCHWVLDGQRLWRYGKEALAAAEAVQRADLATDAMGWLAMADRLDGNVPAALKGLERTIARARKLQLPLSPHMPTFYCVTLYWTGQAEAAIEQGREGVRLARQGSDAGAIVVAHNALGLGLTGRGRYEEALRVLAEGQAFGREHDVVGWTAACLSRQSGRHINLFAYAGAVTRAEDACVLARS